MSNSEMDELQLYEAIRKNIEKRFEFRTQFFGNLVSFMIFVFLVWVIWLGPSMYAFRTYWFAALITGAWAIGVFTHFINWVFFELRENAIRREMDRFGLRPVLPQIEAEKAKRESVQRERLVRLTEDGELEEVNEEDIPAEERRSRA
jgi:hypothetical protein